VITLIVLIAFSYNAIYFIDEGGEITDWERTATRAQTCKAPPPKIRSQRDSDITIIRAFATRKVEPGDQSRGKWPKGVGKSTVMATAMQGLPCVQLELIKPRSDSDVISDQVLEAINRNSNR
jgi:hypothetical protein